MTKLARKAYAVTEECENTGGVIFAACPIVARRIGADEYNSGELAGLHVARAPWADVFAETGRVPASVMIDQGWHFECHGCDMRIDADSLYDHRLPIDGVIGTQGSFVYCCARCRRKRLSLERRRKAEELRAIDVIKAMVLRRFPDATLCDAGGRWSPHAYVTRDWSAGGGWHWAQIVVSFTFPGMKIAPAQLRLDGGHKMGPHKPYFTCCNGDREAFETWAAKS